MLIHVKQGECVPGAVRLSGDGTLYYILEHSGSVGASCNGCVARAYVLDSPRLEEVATVLEYDEHAIFFMMSTAFFD